MLSHLELENFTVFQTLKLDFVPGLNVFVGPNATGKTHLLKLLYAVTEAHRFQNDIAQKLLRVFLPEPRRLGRLARRTKQAQSASVRLVRDGHDLSFRFSSNHSETSFSEFVSHWPAPTSDDGKPVFIPPKDMLAHAPGFLALYEQKEIYFEETYRDILVRAFSPVGKGAPSASRRSLRRKLENLISGKITVENEHFFLKNAQGKLEFTLLAEGLRKFALLLQLIENETLRQSSLLFWDEPEANINPVSIKDLVDLLLHLAREIGVQVFLATHSDFLLKELDLQQRPGEARFFALYREEDKIQVEVAERAESLTRNAIDEENLRLYDEDIARVLGRAKE
ncbi:AAA family ATPase [Polyangium fumosum]|uniref:AAA family ATPase n=1 Tax=Polyangium fumosum TaxID=889272 RepID=A0A4U1JFZ5_9BACT|nr:AAA family ATPase [Polyangium fumosum]TKD10213.1 AAA family ATPase [Polyangium fumosum]